MSQLSMVASSFLTAKPLESSPWSGIGCNGALLDDNKADFRLLLLSGSRRTLPVGVLRRRVILTQVNSMWIKKK